jgi:hypothetical protein
MPFLHLIDWMRRYIGKYSGKLRRSFFLCYIVCYLDRVNVGFAKLQMIGDLHLNDTAYARGAGIFFWGYVLLEVPSNMMLHKFGARRWIARIMISWGIISIATMSFWLPSIIHASGVQSTLAIGVLSAIPFAVATVFMMVNAAHSNITGERRWHAAIPAFMGGFGVAIGGSPSEWTCCAGCNYPVDRT